MAENLLYSVAITGEILAGYEKRDAFEKFAKIYGIRSDKAADVVEKKLVLKKGMNLKSAILYQSKIENAGIATNLILESRDALSAAEKLGSCEDSTLGTKSAGSNVVSIGRQDRTATASLPESVAETAHEEKQARHDAPAPETSSQGTSTAENLSEAASAEPSASNVTCPHCKCNFSLSSEDLAALNLKSVEVSAEDVTKEARPAIQAVAKAVAKTPSVPHSDEQKALVARELTQAVADEKAAAPVVEDKAKTAAAVEAKTVPAVEEKTAPVVEAKAAPVAEAKTAPLAEAKTSPAVEEKTSPAAETAAASVAEDKAVVVAEVVAADSEVALAKEGPVAPLVGKQTANASPLGAEAKGVETSEKSPVAIGETIAPSAVDTSAEEAARVQSARTPSNQKTPISEIAPAPRSKTAAVFVAREPSYSQQIAQASAVPVAAAKPEQQSPIQPDSPAPNNPIAKEVPAEVVPVAAAPVSPEPTPAPTSAPAAPAAEPLNAAGTAAISRAPVEPAATAKPQGKAAVSTAEAASPVPLNPADTQSVPQPVTVPTQAAVPPVKARVHEPVRSDAQTQLQQETPVDANMELTMTQARKQRRGKKPIVKVQKPSEVNELLEKYITHAEQHSSSQLKDMQRQKIIISSLALSLLGGAVWFCLSLL